MLKFGPSGNDEKFYADGFERSVDVFAWLSKMGLDLYEYSFGRGVLLKNETAFAMSQKAKEYGILCSVHAPYFVNLATEDALQEEKNENYILKSLEKLKILGGKKCVVHVGSVRNYDRNFAINLVKENLANIMHKAKQNGFGDLLVCPETMGKYSQIGNVEEIVDICSVDENLVPTFDFGHLNCLAQGGLKTKQDFLKILTLCKDKLGESRLNQSHIHFSKIEYSEKGEVKHLTLSDTQYGPEFLPLAQALIGLNVAPTIVCESKNVMAQDALKLKNIYLSCLDKK